jgi:hypothetical protein
MCDTCPARLPPWFDRPNIIQWTVQIIKLLSVCDPGSSVSIVSGYGLDDRSSRFDPRKRRKYSSSSLCVQKGFGANPASSSLGTEVNFPGSKERPGCDANHSPPSTTVVEK